MASTSKSIAALFVTGLVAIATSAFADGRHDRSGRIEKRAHRDAVVVSRHAAPVVVAPRVAVPARPYVYRPYRPYAYRPSYGYRPHYGYYGYRPYLYAPAVGLSFYFGRPY